MARLKPKPHPPNVEAAPCHDGAPIYTSYTTDDEHRDRPLFAIVVYVTTKEASDPEYVRDLALKIHTGTEREREERESSKYTRDRIEVVGLPQPQATTADSESDEACAERCRVHYLAEVAARMATGKCDFFLPPTYDDDGYSRSLIILRQLSPGWETAALFREPPDVDQGAVMTKDYRGLDPHWAAPPPTSDPGGHLITCHWDFSEEALAEWDTEEDPLPKDPLVVRHLVKDLSQKVSLARLYARRINNYLIWVQ